MNSLTPTNEDLKVNIAIFMKMLRILTMPMLRMQLLMDGG
jgi:hypothetical protein